MKTIGLLGGMSWESTLSYYRIVNEVVKERLGGLHSAQVVLYSVDFHAIEQLQQAGDWETAGRMLGAAASCVEAAGADFVVLCTNTMHRVADAIEASVHIPLLHIADSTADAIKLAGVSKVGLLGTRFTMEQAFYKDRLTGRHGLNVITPGLQDRDTVHRVIYEELCLGRIDDSSRTVYRHIMSKLVAEGAEAIVLGCTEISLLVGSDDATVALFDTTRLHARRAAEYALE